MFNELQSGLRENLLAEDDIRQSNSRLEERVRERTAQIEATKRRLELATHAGKLGVWEYLPQENRVIWDGRMHVLHHVPLGVFPGTMEGWCKYIHPDDLEKFKLNTQLLLTKNLLINDEHRIVWDDGSIRHIATSALTVFSTDGRAERVIGISMDVTERQQIEQSLRESEAYARLLFDAVPDPISVMEVDGTIVDVNRLFEEEFGLRRDEIRGRRIMEVNFFPESLLDNVVNHLEQALSGEKVPPMEMEFSSPHGSLILELHSYPIKINEHYLIMSTYQNITTHKKAEEALKIANKEMEKALRVKDEFLASMSHELRTPLNSILGISESLEEQISGPLTEKQLKHIRIIKESGKHLLALIDDILDIAKIEAGKMSLDTQVISVATLCQSSLRMVREMAQKKSIEMLLDIENNIRTIVGDERRLKQTFVNLLSNAIKFSSIGRQIGLKVTGRPERSEITFTVWDEGIGIAEEHLADVFKPFVQLDAGLTREYEGTGLGLAIVAQMVRLHGGRVDVFSQAEKGSQFSVILPWQADAQGMVEKNTGELSGKVPEQNVECRGKLLLVEDSEAVVNLMSEYLNKKGYQVIVATNGNEGVLLAKSEHPDIILMDVMMPVMNGIEATKKIRSDTSLDDITIIGLTALAMSGDRERCLAAGMDDYMSKPISMPELLKKLTHHFNTPRKA